MNSEEVKRRIDQEDDFVYMPRFDYSLEKFLDKYPEGANNRLIAQALMMTEEEVEELYKEAVKQLREALGVTLED
jgi:hypothetical protein